MSSRLAALLGACVLLSGGCDDSYTSHYTTCYRDETGEVVYERCCETKCKYDDDCGYYYGDCDVDCTETCYNVGPTPVSTAVYVTPGRGMPTPTPTP